MFRYFQEHPSTSYVGAEADDCPTFRILPSVRLFIKSERWQVVGFSPHATSAGVFGINLSTLYPNFGYFEGGVQRNEPGNRTIRLYHSHLAIEVYNFKFRRSP